MANVVFTAQFRVAHAAGSKLAYLQGVSQTQLLLTRLAITARCHHVCRVLGRGSQHQMRRIDTTAIGVVIRRIEHIAGVHHEQPVRDQAMSHLPHEAMDRDHPTAGPAFGDDPVPHRPNGSGPQPAVRSEVTDNSLPESLRRTLLLVSRQITRPCMAAPAGAEVRIELHQGATSSLVLPAVVQGSRRSYRTVSRLRCR